MDVKLGYAPKFFRNGELSVREASRGFIYSMKASGSIQTGTLEALENTLALFAPFPAESIDMKPINDPEVVRLLLRNGYPIPENVP